MKRLSRIKKIAIAGAAILTAVVMTVLLVAPTGAVSGNVAATGTNNEKITVSISDLSADFGTFDPTGSLSGGDEVDDSLSSSAGNQGVCLLWNTSGGDGLEVKVKSNKAWTGTVNASENSGTSTTLTLANGDFRYHTSTPASYSACSSSGAAFSTSPAQFEDNGSLGASTYTYYYSLTVDWDDVPGTFTSTVTYSVSQS